MYLKDDAQPIIDIEEVSFEEVQTSEPRLQNPDEVEEIDETTISSEARDLLEQTSPDVEVEEGKIEVDEGIVEVDEDEVVNDQADSSSQAPQNDTIPSEINLAVPFTSQAPQANWDLPYQEACEEASAYMTWLYFEGYQSGLVNAHVADAAILDLVDYQVQSTGYYLDTTAQETADFITGYYGLNTYVVHSPTVDQLKAQIALGYPVIIPAAGRELGNPNFSGDGPLYHMLVLRGYTQTQWITNDPGTRNGQGYVYDIDVIMDAMGDWNDGDPANGAKVVIFVEPQ